MSEAALELVDGLATRLVACAPRRLAVSPTEAATALGVSLDFYSEHVAPEVRAIRRGRKVIVPVAELERWLEESAARTLEGQR